MIYNNYLLFSYLRSIPQPRILKLQNTEISPRPQIISCHRGQSPSIPPVPAGVFPNFNPQILPQPDNQIYDEVYDEETNDKQKSKIKELEAVLEGQKKKLKKYEDTINEVVVVCTD